MLRERALVETTALIARTTAVLRQAHMVEQEAHSIHGPKLLGPLGGLPARRQVDQKWCSLPAGRARCGAAGRVHHARSSGGMRAPAGSRAGGHQGRAHGALRTLGHHAGHDSDAAKNQSLAQHAALCSNHEKGGLRRRCVCAGRARRRRARLWMSPRRRAPTMPSRPYCGPGRLLSARARRPTSA